MAHHRTLPTGAQLCSLLRGSWLLLREVKMRTPQAPALPALLCLLLSALPLASLEQNEVPDKKDMLFLIDGSDNVRPGFPVLKEFMREVVERLDVGPDRVRVAVVQYSDHPRVEFNFSSYEDREGVLGALRSLSPLGGPAPSTGAALDFVHRNVLVESAGCRAEQRVRQMLVVVTADRSRDDVHVPAISLKMEGAVPIAIGIGDADIAEMQNISWVPDLAFTFPLFSQFSALKNVIASRVAKLNRKELLELVPEEPNTPGNFTEKKDMLFLIDGSDNVRPDFPVLKEFMEEVVEHLDVGPDLVRVAVVQYSNHPQVEFNFSSYEDREGVLGALRSLSPLGGPAPSTGAALDFVHTKVLVESAGNRAEQRVPQILIVVTANQSQDYVWDAATMLKMQGALLLGIGIGDAEISDMRSISLVPNMALIVPDFSQFSIVKKVIAAYVARLNRQELLQLVPEETHAPGNRDQKDVVFLLEGSQRASPHFSHMLALVERLVRSLDRGFNATRVAVIQFSEGPKVEFLLNAHSNQSEVLAALSHLQPQGGQGAKLGAALQYVTRSVFQRQMGSRIEEGVAQLLVVVSAGPSQDELDAAAAELHRAGVAPLTVSLHAQRQELAQVALSPDHVFTVGTFQELPWLEYRLLIPVMTLSAERIHQLLKGSQDPQGEPDPHNP